MQYNGGMNTTEPQIIAQIKQAAHVVEARV